MKKRKHLLDNKQDGFTLIEVVIALAILAIWMLSVYAAQGNAIKAMGSSRNIFIASSLAERILNEQMLIVEEETQKGSFPEDGFEEDGEFEEPFEKFRWEFKARKVEIPLVGDLEDQNQASQPSTSTAPSQTLASSSDQRMLAQLVSKKIEESVREIQVKITWEELGVEEDFVLTSHIARLQ